MGLRVWYNKFKVYDLIRLNCYVLEVSNRLKVEFDRLILFNFFISCLKVFFNVYIKYIV